MRISEIIIISEVIGDYLGSIASCTPSIFLNFIFALVRIYKEEVMFFWICENREE